ncbi:HAD-IA family hydrolase [Shewanella sp. HN-41]|uniref:HAD-IA family hydrolase n=1 Tax=Shewanella sp. HN-41 TaxID=327275 RepID=UPI0002125AF0|nr:HAD-IA family hydrolase [Shewanella sp. HN-41]EGM71763.1 2-haloalkanoic acid dehalogenase [Shewanella sp. HN-41]
MRCYLRPQNIHAISFDLDDTLYNNQPYILNAEAELTQFLHQSFPLTAAWQPQDWRRLKLLLLQQMPELAHDTTAARVATLRQGLLQLGYSESEAERGAAEGLACFYFHRSHFQVSSEVLSLLRRLSQRFRLVGITNGNVDAGRIGLGDTLEFVLHPGNGVRMKPAKDMFDLACTRLDIYPEQLLHVGDSLNADVRGARLAGCQSVWLNPSFGQVESLPIAALLPHMEIAALGSLSDIL